MTIVIPMAGNSARFFKAGFTRPKYELVSHGRSLLEWSLLSFERYFGTEHFVLVCRADFNARAFVRDACAKLEVRSWEVVEVDGATRGQADTVMRAAAAFTQLRSAPLTIFNIDTVRLGFALSERNRQAAGVLEVFEGEGDNWSFAKTSSADPDKVVEVAEKVPISNLCSTGLYWFQSAELFIDAFEQAETSESFIKEWRELYVAPLYNRLITSGLDVRVQRIDRAEVQFVGTPAEYKEFKLVTPLGR